MKAHRSIRPFASFLIAMMIGAYSTSFLVNGSFNKEEHVAFTSPELYNSAFSPSGEKGGEIIPASCSIGYPSDASDGFAPCPVPQVTLFPSNSVTLTGGGYIPSWGFTSTNASFCYFLTSSMSPANSGPVYNYGTDPNKTYPNFGPFSNVTGQVRYTIECWDANKTVNDTEIFTVNLVRAPEVNLLFGDSTNPFLNIASFSGPADAITSATLSWNVTGATSCSATGPIGWAGSAISLPSGSRTVSYSGAYPITRTYTLTCTNGTDSVARSVTINYEGTGYTGCFVAGTKVRMADGSLREIETVKAGESILTSNGPGIVEKAWHIPYKGNVHAFNGSNHYFVTDTHPFMTEDGWKSFNPDGAMRENPGLEVSLLEIGDVLLREDGSKVVLERVDSKYTEETVYNFRVQGSADYYADGYWVHNAISKVEP